MPELLELPHLVEQHRVSQMQVRRGRIEARLHPQRLAAPQLSDQLRRRAAPRACRARARPAGRRNPSWVFQRSATGFGLTEARAARALTGRLSARVGFARPRAAKCSRWPHASDRHSSNWLVGLEISWTRWLQLAVGAWSPGSGCGPAQRLRLSMRVFRRLPTAAAIAPAGATSGTRSRELPGREVGADAKSDPPKPIWLRKSPLPRPPLAPPIETTDLSSSPPTTPWIASSAS